MSTKAFIRVSTLLQDTEKNKIDILMKCLTVITAFISNDENNYRTGVGLRGDVQKNWNPNIRVSLVSPIVFCADYFGGSIDRVLSDEQKEKPGQIPLAELSEEKQQLIKVVLEMTDERAAALHRALNE